MLKSDFLEIVADSDGFQIPYPQDGPLELEADILWSLADTVLKYGSLFNEERINLFFFGLYISLDASNGRGKMVVVREEWLESRIEDDPCSFDDLSFVFDSANEIEICWEKDISVSEVRDAITILDLFSNLSGFWQEGKRLMLLEGLLKIKVTDIIKGMERISERWIFVAPIHLTVEAILSIFDKPNTFSVVHIGNMSIICLAVKEESSGASVIKGGILNSLRPLLIKKPARKIILAM